MPPHTTLQPARMQAEVKTPKLGVRDLTDLVVAVPGRISLSEEVSTERKLESVATLKDKRLRRPRGGKRKSIRIAKLTDRGQRRQGSKTNTLT